MLRLPALRARPELSALPPLAMEGGQSWTANRTPNGVVLAVLSRCIRCGGTLRKGDT